MINKAWISITVKTVISLICISALIPVVYLFTFPIHIVALVLLWFDRNTKTTPKLLWTVLPIVTYFLLSALIMSIELNQPFLDVFMHRLDQIGL